MLRIAVMGAVNSGKTTFVNLYVKKLEKYGRTETLSLLDGSIGSVKVQFIDCPGHSALSYAKNISLTIADAVIYVVNSEDLNFELLEEISKIKPVLILFNRWNSKIQLKDYFYGKEQNQLYIDLVNKCKNLNISYAPFFDTDVNSSCCFLFPINFVSKWGVSEFETYFKKRWIPFLNPPHKEYLYLIEDLNNNYKFKSTKTESEQATIVINGVKGTYNTFFNHNVVDKTYTLKQDFNMFMNPVYVLDCDNSYVKTVELPSEFSVSQELELILSRSKILNLEATVYGDTPHKIHTLSQFFEKYTISHIIPKKLSFLQFKNLSAKLKIAWVDLEHDEINYEKGICYTDSYYKLENYLKEYLKLKLQEYVKKQLQNIKKEFVFELLPQYVFKQNKLEFVIGCRLILGSIPEGASFILKNVTLYRYINK